MGLLPEVSKVIVKRVRDKVRSIRLAPAIPGWPVLLSKTSSKSASPKWHARSAQPYDSVCRLYMQS